MPLSPIREITELEVAPLAGESVAGKLDPEIDLNFPGLETQHSTHAIHPYVAAINPPLAAALIEHYLPRGESLLDPFCGGGGVLIEALRHGRRSTGCDVNPLAVLLSRVKTKRLPSGKLLALFQAITDRAACAARAVAIDEVPDVVRFWYREDCLRPLLALRDEILEIPDENFRVFYQAVLSATSRDVMLTYRGEVRLHKMQGKDLERFHPNVWVAFKKRALTAMKLVAELPDGDCFVELRDSRNVTKDHECHTVVTSPPYGDDKNGVGYFQFSRNMLWWIGVALEEQKRMRQAFLGAIVSDREPPPSETLSGVLAAIRAVKESQRLEALAFYSDYNEALQRIASVTKHRVIIVIGDRVLGRTKIPNGQITTELMSDLGWRLEHYYNRELRKKRIPNLGNDGGGISLEHIMVFCR